LHQATAAARWLTAATELLDAALARFADDAAPGAFHDTAADAERLVLRPADPTDNASPSGASSLAAAALAAAALAGPERAAAYRALAGGSPTAYVCRGYVCHTPVTSVDALIASLCPSG